MTTMLIADDHPVIRRGLRTLFEAAPDLEVVGEADDGEKTLQLAARLQPDVLVLDIMMPGLGGLEVLRVLPERAPHTRVVVLSLHGSTSIVAEAIKNGKASYVLKGSSEEELLLAVRETAAGRRFLSSTLSEKAVSEFLRRTRTCSFDPYEALTAREREILQLAAEGCTSVEISRRLHISARTVENHRAHLMRKLGLINQTELVRYALRRGLISLEE